MVRHSDRYLADQYLRRERREGRAHAAWPEESDPQDTTTSWVRHYAEAPEAWIGVGTGPDRRRAGVGRGYPLGRGRPEDIPHGVWGTRGMSHMGKGGPWAISSKISKRCQVVKKMSSCQKDVKCQKMKHLDYGGGSQKN